MNRNENEVSEMYDYMGSELARRRKKKKIFMRVLVGTVVGIIVLFLTIFFISQYIESHKPIEEIKSDITASGKAFYLKKAESVYSILDIVESKKTLIYIDDSQTTGDYLTNNNYIVYTDGTYYEVIRESINGEYHEERNVGKIDLASFENYINLHSEKLKEFEEIEYLNEDDDFVEANYCMILANGVYRNIYMDNQEYHDIFSIYIGSAKEEVQNYKIKKG